MENTSYAFGLIDAQRGFMPAPEGDRLGVAGFGELPIPRGEQIVPLVKQLVGAAVLKGYELFTTQDWHPHATVHFSESPNYATTWPVHCVADTPGAELHPDITVPNKTARFLKGDVPSAEGEQDDSYSGYNGHTEDGEAFGDWLRRHGITHVALGGLALDYCVKATALDLKQKANLDVVVISDATAAVAPETGKRAIAELEAAGIRFTTTADWIE